MLSGYGASNRTRGRHQQSRGSWLVFSPKKGGHLFRYFLDFSLFEGAFGHLFPLFEWQRSGLRPDSGTNVRKTRPWPRIMPFNGINVRTGSAYPICSAYPIVHKALLIRPDLTSWFSGIFVLCSPLPPGDDIGPLKNVNRSQIDYTEGETT